MTGALWDDRCTYKWQFPSHFSFIQSTVKLKILTVSSSSLYFIVWNSTENNMICWRSVSDSNISSLPYSKSCKDSSSFCQLKGAVQT